MCNLDRECAASLKLSIKSGSRSSCGVKSEALSGNEAARVCRPVGSEWSRAVEISFGPCWGVLTA